MGQSTFIEDVFSFRSENKIFFFLLGENGKFYIMDAKKNIKVLEKDPDSNKLNLENQFYLQKKDKEKLIYSAFDNFVVSSNLCIHWR